MAEQDWFGPLRDLTRRVLAPVTMVVGGIGFVIAGLLGYETGKLGPRQSRWSDSPIWFEVIAGLLCLVVAAWDLRRAKKRAFRQEGHGGLEGPKGLRR